MPITPRVLLIGILPFALAGCCAFVPCHPATALVGTVVAADGAPASSVRLTLYGSRVSTDSKGCFKVRIPDALPFTFGAAAEGYKPVEVVAKPGFYRAKVNLVPVQSTEASRAEWLSISSSEYEGFSCP